MKGYYLTYNSGCGTFGYVSETAPQFSPRGKAIVFATKADARKVLKYVLNGLNKDVAKKFGIVSTDEASYVKNK